MNLPHRPGAKSRREEDEGKRNTHQERLTDAEKVRVRRDLVQQSLILMLAVVTVLTVIGIFMVFSATTVASIRAADRSAEGTKLFSVAIKHTVYILAGVSAGFVLAHFTPKFYFRHFRAIFAAALILQLMVIFFGKEIYGNRNWLMLGPVQIQPSEFLKGALVIWLAAVLSRINAADLKKETLTVPVLGFISATAAVLIPGDMGTALIYVAIGAGMLWVAGISRKFFLRSMVAAVLLAALFIAFKPSRLARVTGFFTNLVTLPDTVAPTQSEFAQFAFGTGGMTGVGLGAGKEKWLDLREAHTDFIFAVIGEELGLFGTLTVLFLFLVLAWVFLRLALNHPSRFGQLTIAGAGLWICGQAFANMCVVTGLLPVFGVPLPFISQGGSAVIANLAMVAVVAAFSLSVPGVRESMKIRSGIVHRAKAIVRKNHE
ncbi:FtsW/RodA/SpoVE family cell cycle protein [Arcanobacterium sp. S3PF19]|uniref:FtsW/RodA/SpoVE family cell cycle protein n=1 Tax=Arcanobacterium sp. S3PF19 TaxID=1219585 RepID=UPI00068E39EB|nr:putative peptidoglycan glycosyltransferase FtsW [Arcanobacterium sp. S3PF19]